MTILRYLRRVPVVLLGAMLLLSNVTFAQDIDSPTLYFRPHCENPDATLCPFYDVKDPTTLSTAPLKPGDELDMDVVLFNPKAEKIKQFRVWLSYDPAVLQGKSVEISPTFPVIVPGQADFAPQSGNVKIASGAADGQEVSAPFVPLVRVKFTVSVNASTVQSPIGFHDFKDGIDGHVVITSLATPTANMIVGPLGSLVADVRSTATPSSVASVAASASSTAAPVIPVPISSAAASSAQPVSSATAQTSSVTTVSSVSSHSSLSSLSSIPSSSVSSASSVSSVSSVSTSFELLQVQSVGIGTEGTSLKITWAPLSHPKLQGYNVYYGTLPGRYLQRKSVSVAAVGTVIRDLPRGETYYAAVRGVDDQNRETAFSDEVSVEIGNPATASAVLGSVTNLVDEGPGDDPEHQHGENPLDTVSRPDSVPGGTGLPADLLMLIGSSAATGTLFALRRQLTASRARPR